MNDHATIEGRVVAAGHGWTWIAVAFALFRRAPGPWILRFVIWAVIYLVASAIPLGSLASTLMNAVFVGGWMIGCRSLDRSGSLKLEHLFAGFRSEQLGSLVMVGAIYLGGTILVMLIVGLTVGGSMLPLLFGRSDPTRLHWDLGILLGLLVIAALMIPLMMALWFAPALVLFNSQSPIEAMRASFKACLRNVAPFLVYGLVVMVLGLVATLPLMLGWLVLGPVLIASIYASYCDVFETLLPAASPDVTASTRAL